MTINPRRPRNNRVREAKAQVWTHATAVNNFQLKNRRWSSERAGLEWTIFTSQRKTSAVIWGDLGKAIFCCFSLFVFVVCFREKKNNQTNKNKRPSNGAVGVRTERNCSNWMRHWGSWSSVDRWEPHQTHPSYITWRHVAEFIAVNSHSDEAVICFHHKYWSHGRWRECDYTKIEKREEYCAILDEQRNWLGSRLEIWPNSISKWKSLLFGLIELWKVSELEIVGKMRILAIKYNWFLDRWRCLGGFRNIFDFEVGFKL